MLANRALFFFLMFLAMIAWGGSWVNAKVLSSYINEYELIFVRYSITIVTMLPFLKYFKSHLKLDLKTWGLVVLASIILICYMKFYFLGTKLGTASLGGAFVTTLIPIITFILMVLFFGKKSRKKDFFALLLGAVGVMMILGVWHLEASKVFTQYNLYFIFAALFWPLLTIVSSKSKKTHPVVFTFYMYIITVALMALFFVDLDFVTSIEYDTVFIFNALCISIGASTFANSMFFMAIEKLGASEASAFTFLVPFSAIGLSALFLDEKISLFMVFGTILTLIAVSILNNIKLPLKSKLL